MTTTIALLRAVNVGGKNRVPMAELRACLEAGGCVEPRTILQSGNAVFKTAAKRARLEKQLASICKRTFSLDIDFICRDVAQWKKIIAHNPFPRAAVRDPGHLVVMFLKSAPSKLSVDELIGRMTGEERLEVDGAQLYITYPKGIGTSRFTGTLIEKVLGIRGTGRNWNTILKLEAACEF